MKKTHPRNSAQAAVELAIFGSLILLAFSVLLMYGQRLDSQQQVKMEAFRRALQKAYQRNGSVNYTYKKEDRSFNLFGGFGQGQPSTVSSSASVSWSKGIPGPQEGEDSIMFDIPIVGVVWAILDPENMGANRMKEGSYSYYAINDQEMELAKYPKQQIDINGKLVTIYAPVSVYNEEQRRDESFSSNVVRQETPEFGIVNTKVSKLKDTISTTLHVRFDDSEADATKANTAVLPKYVYENEEYEDEDMKKQTVKPVDNQIVLGAYARDDINRVGYSKDKVGTTIQRQRTWETVNK
jgi:hypothetical protein